MRSRAAIAGTVAAVVLVAAGAVTGAAVALQLGGTSEHQTRLARVAVVVSPSLDGEARLFVPLVDWGMRADAWRSPVDVTAEVRAIDRQRVRAALERPREAPREVDQARDDARRVVEAALRRGAAVALLGAIIGGLLAGGIVGALAHRRRLLVQGAVAGGVLGALGIFVIAVDIEHHDRGAFRHPVFEGRGAELPRLVGFSDQLLHVGEEYADHYARAVASVTNLAEVAPDELDSDRDARIVVASDLHNNQLVLPGFREVAGEAPVVLVGDFGQLGTRFEEGMAPAIAGMAEEVLAVSGNHDSAGFMAALARAGVTVVRSAGPPCELRDVTCRGGLLEVQGLLLAGYDDPLERAAGADIARHVLRVYGPTYRAQQEAFVEWFDALPTRPDVVAVHQHGLGHHLLDRLHARGDDRSLVVLVGHDHHAHVERVGPHLLVDGGTLGAGGPAAIGEQDASFAVLHLRRSRPYAVDLVSVEPVSGRASMRRELVADLPADGTAVTASTTKLVGER